MNHPEGDPPHHDDAANPTSEAPRCFVVTIEPAGWRFEAPEDLPLLQSARQAGIEMPSSCRNGTCRACLVRMTHGAVRYRIAWPGLSAEEKAEGDVLPCVAHPCADLSLLQAAAKLSGA
jgi:ferredoxin